MDTETRTLIDVFMPNDLCARCDENEPRREFSLIAEPSPPSTFEPTRLSFCSAECRRLFVRGWGAAKELDGLG